jgi:cytochrome c
METRKYRSSLGLALVLSLTGCSYEVQKTGPSEIVDAQNLTLFENLQQGLFQPSCVRCHSGPNAKGGIDLASYDSILSNSRPLVVPGSSSESLLYAVVAEGEMPPRGPRIEPAVTDLLKQWIDQGARNE